MDLHHFQRITAFVEARLTPLFDAATGSTHGFGMDDTSRALRALRATALAASAVEGVIEQRGAADAEVRRIADQALAHSWDVLQRIARNWEDHPDFLREFKRDSWEFGQESASSAPAKG
ncbi:hypothetical protein J7E88_09950 [Streptomyces sp. ISL-10]|uniref:hypothetical protein n=1 Tax=Streptomyces sp. ISL-10 TaxID=2819172 RepID=UPI001BE75E6F|nr:hypothetical protein [Streptomyces sp. ISL-10]MBT2365633.1 hypothetical protein [Streptomyces sp. ISL-10]